jgi:hypothetical protein
MSRRKRQVVLHNPGQSAGLGTAAELRRTLADFNTAPDGSVSKSMGTQFLYGPGFLVEVASTQELVTQAIITLQDEDIGLPVLFRLCRASGWKMVDIESGRTFG